MNSIQNENIDSGYYLPCYENFIGIRGENSANKPRQRPRSGLYIEDIRGINIKFASDISNDKSGLEFLKEAIYKGIDDTVHDALHELPCYQFNNILDVSLNNRYINKTTQIVPVGESDQWQGTQFIKTLPRYQTLSTFFLNTVYYKAAVDVPSVYLYIRDNNKEHLIAANGFLYLIETKDTNGYPLTASFEGETVNVVDIELPSAAAGEVLVIQNIDYLVKGDDFAIITDNSVPLYVCDFDIRSCGCTGSSNGLYWQRRSFGISVDMSYKCVSDRVSCAILMTLRKAILHAVGIEIINEIIASTRLNFITIHSKEWATEKALPDLQEAYKMEINRTKRSLNTIVRSIDKNCFECNKNIIVTQLS